MFMSRISPDEAFGAQFRQVLADVRQAADREAEPPHPEGTLTGFSPVAMASAIFTVDDGRQRTTGGAANWRAALDWIEEQDEPTALVESQTGDDESAEGIRAELGLDEDLTDAELTRLWRRYMWRNHPDRHREAQRAGLTRKVALANMLFDRARSRLIARRSS